MTRSQDSLPVEKIRRGFTSDGIICEYAQVSMNGALLESACVESEDNEAMRGGPSAAYMPGEMWPKAQETPSRRMRRWSSAVNALCVTR